jgi:hypothetical protein
LLGYDFLDALLYVFHLIPLLESSGFYAKSILPNPARAT